MGRHRPAHQCHGVGLVVVAVTAVASRWVSPPLEHVVGFHPRAFGVWGLVPKTLARPADQPRTMGAGDGGWRNQCGLQLVSHDR